MALISENQPLLERQHAIIRQLEGNRDLTPAERESLQAEYDKLQLSITENTLEYFSKHKMTVRASRPDLSGKSRREIKKLVAHWLKELVKDLDEDTRNGAFRYAYKGE